MKHCSGWTGWAGIMLLLAGSALAGVKTWQAGAGNWEEGSNWDGGLPVAGDDAVITNAGANVLLSSATPVLGSLKLSRMLVFNNWSTMLRAQAVVIESCGVMTLPGAFTELQMSNRVWIVCSNLTVASSARIDVTGKGYVGGDKATGSSGAGQGGGQGSTAGRGGGGGYGGRGGWGIYATGAWSLRGGVDYGDAVASESPGSGGGALKNAAAGGGAGGGAVRIEATGAVVVDGAIVANGANALRYSGGGSGGGIWIVCRQFGGNGGRFSANGGARGDDGGGGGGGRIALDYASLIDEPTVRFEAREAPCIVPSWHTAARWHTHWLSCHGTLWFPDSQLLTATLDRFYGTIIRSDVAGWPPDSLTVSNGLVALAGGPFEIDGTLTVGRDGVLVLEPDGPVRVGGETVVDGGRFVLNVFTQMVCEASLTVTNGGVLHVGAAPTNGTVAFGASVDVAGDIRVAGTSWIIPDCQGTNGGPVRWRCASARIDAQGGIDATGRGFLGGDTVAGQKGWGPGGGTAGVIGYYGAGGGHGGQGGWSWYIAPYGWGKAGGPAYGNTNAPVMPGSGGGSFNGFFAGHGGGTVWIEARESIILDGDILADASLPLSYAGGGAGGGVFLAARDFRGSVGSRISASGSPGGDRGGPGGGGRIAVAIGLDATAVQTLIDDEPLPGLYDYSRHGRFNGAMRVAVGEPGPDYTGEAWRAPQPGTALFLTTNITFHITGAPGDYGHPAPDPYGGCPYYTPDSWITNRVVTPDDEAGGTRHACIGWTLHDASGSLLASSVSTQAIFQLAATRLLTWKWTNEYYLAVLDGPNGSVTTDASDWYTHATIVADIAATPDSGYLFDRWVGDYPEGCETVNPLSVTMDRPRTLTPVFASASGLDKDWIGGASAWEDPDNWAPPGMPGLYDRVSITSGIAIINLPRQAASVVVGNGGTLLFTNWVASLTASNVMIAAGGRVTLPPAFTDAGMSNRVWIMCANLVVASGGMIDATGRGYQGGYNGSDGCGPGGGLGGHHGGGGGHGGVGGCGTKLIGGPVYDEAADPQFPGSGGGSHPDTRSRGGAGGGVVRIEAAGDVQIDGTIAANGTDATYYSGGGAGGAVMIRCSRFGGGGLITANGGLRANSGGGGGGGRIAVAYESLEGMPGVRIETREQDSLWPMWAASLRWSQYRWTGQPGTLHFSDAALLREVVTNLYGEIHVPAFSSWSPASLAISNALLRLPAGFDLRVAGDLIAGAGGAIELMSGAFLQTQGDVRLDGGRLVLNGFTQAIFRADLDLANGGRFYAYSAPTNNSTARGASVDVAGEIRVGSASWIHPDASGTNGAVVRFRCANARIAASGGFDADGRGFCGGFLTFSRAGFGPGAGGVDNCGPGGGYGGRGGDAYEVTRWGALGGLPYGVIAGPVWPGSGGGSYKDGRGGHGGGMIWLDVEGMLHVDGLLSANGGVADTYSGGGSGGGILVLASRFSGSGTAILRVNGSDGASPPRGGPGGGGRIIVAVGLTAAERDRLQTDQARNLRTAASHAPYAGLLEADAGVLGADYTSAPERAPQPGSLLFIKSAGGMILLVR